MNFMKLMTKVSANINSTAQLKEAEVGGKLLLYGWQVGFSVLVIAVCFWNKSTFSLDALGDDAGGNCLTDILAFGGISCFFL